MDPSLAVATTAAAGEAITAAGRRHPTDPVAACPGWDVADLVLHMGQVHAWAAANLSGDGDTPAPFPEPPDGDVCDWADQQRAALLDVLSKGDPDRLVWGFRPQVPARFWYRRQAHETALHAWDATTTVSVGAVWDFPPGVAADGVSEVLEVFLPRRFRQNEPTWGAGRTVALRCADGDWSFAVDASGIEPAGDADLTVEGTALDLLLWLTNRPNHASIAGDTSLAEAWAAHFAL
jgi:uncharacterized protein (TIGR03083 family)